MCTRQTYVHFPGGDMASLLIRLQDHKDCVMQQQYLTWIINNLWLVMDSAWIWALQHSSQAISISPKMHLSILPIPSFVKKMVAYCSLKIFFTWEINFLFPDIWSCPDGYTMVYSKCLKVCKDEQVTQIKAHMECSASSGSLAMPDSIFQVCKH